MTKLERKRFLKFWLKHPFSHIKYDYLLGCGYAVYAISFNGKYKEDITDVDYMLDNIQYGKKIRSK